MRVDTQISFPYLHVHFVSYVMYVGVLILSMWCVAFLRVGFRFMQWWDAVVSGASDATIRVDNVNGSVANNERTITFAYINMVFVSCGVAGLLNLHNLWTAHWGVTLQNFH